MVFFKIVSILNVLYLLELLADSSNLLFSTDTLTAPAHAISFFDLVSETVTF